MPSLPVVVDLGANHGDFRAAFAGHFKAGRYIAVEANPKLAEALRADPAGEVVNCAVAPSNEPVRFRIEKNSQASRVSETNDADTVQIQGRTLASIMEEKRVDRVDLLKVDIEGAELSMILDAPPATLRRIMQITIEFHDFCNLYPPDQVRQMVERLRSSGFVAIRFSRDNTNWCFVRRDAPAASPVRIMIAKHITANLRRLKHFWIR